MIDRDWVTKKIYMGGIELNIFLKGNNYVIITWKSLTWLGWFLNISFDSNEYNFLIFRSKTLLNQLQKKNII